MTLIISNITVLNSLNSSQSMYNPYTKFVKALDICKFYSEIFIIELDNIPRLSNYRSPNYKHRTKLLAVSREKNLQLIATFACSKTILF